MQLNDNNAVFEISVTALFQITKSGLPVHQMGFHFMMLTASYSVSRTTGRRVNVGSLLRVLFEEKENIFSSHHHAFKADLYFCVESTL